MEYFIIFSLPLLILFQPRVVFSERSVLAITDICNRFPYASACRKNGTADGATKSYNRIVENVAVGDPMNMDNTRNQDTAEFCTKYSVKYVNYCTATQSENVLKHFCTLYNTKCSQVAPISQVTPLVQNINPQTNTGLVGPVNPYWRNMKLTQEDIAQYCSTYRNDYPHCLREKLRHDAVQFCAAYRELCPNWAPEKLQPFSAGSGSSQSPFGIPVDGDIGGMMGIPTDGGNGPLTGLRNTGNNMHVPFFGGPVDGGIGFGRSVAAPFFDANKGFNVVPTKSFTEGQTYRFAGMSAGGGSGVDWSGTPGLGLLNRAIGLNSK